MDDVLSSLMSARIGGILKQAETLSRVPHKGLRGRFRELLVGGILGQVLPPTCTVMHGTVIDADGRRYDASLSQGEKRKTEDDVLIVDAEVLAPLLFSVTDGIVPAEAVLARIEVKSTLDAAGLRDAVLGASQFRALELKIPKGENQTVQAVFAFGTDLTGTRKSELGRLREALEGGAPDGSDPPVQALCVVGSGLWTWGRKKSSGGRGWRLAEADDAHNEVLAFVGILMNSLPGLRELRRAARLGNYIVDMDKIRDCD